MKLYTEYNLKEVYFKGLDNGKNHIEGECHDAIDSQTPIELPSDEEIEKQSQALSIHSLYEFGFKQGAKWMKEQLIKLR